MLDVGKYRESDYMDVFRKGASGFSKPLRCGPKSKQNTANGPEHSDDKAEILHVSLREPIRHAMRCRLALPRCIQACQSLKKRKPCLPSSQASALPVEPMHTIYPLQVVPRVVSNAGQPVVTNLWTPQLWSPMDIAKMKEMLGGFSKKPQEVITYLESLFQTAQPTWQDVRAMAQMLFTEVE